MDQLRADKPKLNLEKSRDLLAISRTSACSRQGCISLEGTGSQLWVALGTSFASEWAGDNYSQECPALADMAAATISGWARPCDTRTLVTSRLDYCNILYVGMPLKIVQKLQQVHNTTIGIIMVHIVHNTTPDRQEL